MRFLSLGWPLPQLSAANTAINMLTVRNTFSVLANPICAVGTASTSLHRHGLLRSGGEGPAADPSSMPDLGLLGL